MRVWPFVAIGVFSLGLAGCGHSNDNSARQAAIVEQILPSPLADAPTRVDLPKWGVQNPHVHLRNRGNIVEFYSLEHDWSGRTVTVYYVPFANVELEHGDYSLHSNYPLQRIATAPLKRDGTWVAEWNLKGHELPDQFYVLVRTDVGQVTVEKVMWQDHRLVITGGKQVL